MAPGNSDAPSGNLADQVAALQTQLLALWQTTPPGPERDALTVQLTKMTNESASLVGQAMDQADQSYRDATASLIAATTAVQQAQAQVASIEAAVQSVTDAVSKIAAIAAKLP